MIKMARWIGLTASIALCYFVLGKLGLAVALPPGFVSAIWPAAGFAFAVTVLLGARATWMGILLGATVTNATVGGGFHLGTVAIGIAAGSTLQAALGGFTMNKLMPNFELNDPHKVLRFSLVGVASCLIAATIGNLVLLANGFIAPPEIPQSFATWWLGDAFGVQIFAPLTLMVLAPNAMWKQRRLSVGAPLLVAFLLSGAIYYFVRDSDEQQLRRSFSAATAPFDYELRALDRNSGQALRQLAASYSLREETPGAEFAPAAAAINKSLSTLRAIEWAPVLDAKALSIYSSQARANSLYAPVRWPAGFQRGADGLVAPIALIYPEAGNEAAMGIDVLAEPRRALTVRNALASGQLTMTPPLRLEQDPEGPGAVLLMAPVKNRVTQGVIMGVLDLRVIGQPLAAIPGTVWELREITSHGDQTIWKSSTVPMPEFSTPTFLDRLGVYSQQTLELGGREWKILLHRPHARLVADASNSPLLVLLLALFACGVITNYLLIRTGEHERIAAEVLDKTASLNAEIVERKAYQSALERSKLNAEGANVAKSQFLATMSHEIRTPMNGILGMAQLLLMPNVNDAQRRDYVRTILSSGQTLLTLLNDILDLSKIEAGKFQLDSTVFDPRMVLRETCALFAGAAKAKSLEIDFLWRGPIDQRYQSDSHRIRQMLSNLIGNAIKFTSQGQVQVEGTELKRDAQSALLEFSVSDTGLGIAADKMGLLFKPFSQADSSTTREYGGSGLGLSIVLSLAKALGGDVGVESSPGKGSRFWFRVMAKPVMSDKESRTVPRANPVTNAVELHGRVLVVEDNPINCMVVQSLLDRLGVSTALVNDGQEAVNTITHGTRESRPDLILMDLHMPVLDGYAAAQQIRQWEEKNALPRLTIIALTADAYDEDRQRCIAAGMDDFLTKPISLDALQQALVRWLPRMAEVLPRKVTLAQSFQPVDRQQVVALAAEVMPLLEHNKFSALAKIEELQHVVAATRLEPEIADVADLLKTFRFNLALVRLRQIVDALSE